MHVNNEIGTIQPIEEIGKYLKSLDEKIYLHVDAVQSYAKIKFRPSRYNIDFMSVSGHKLHGPKGIGFMYVKENNRIKPLLTGGGQEIGIRSGTENVPGIYGIGEAVKVINELKPLVKDATCDVVVCPTFVCLDAVLKAVEGSNIKVAAQNMHFEEKGAFTGEVAPGMLEAMGVSYVVLGHSERREYFNETDEALNKKVKAAFAHNLTPILCCGETLEQRENGTTNEVVGAQIKADLEGLSPELAEKVVIAYEPIWAIGTGKTATDEQANETIMAVRSVVAEMFGQEVANKVRIQYGGSVKPGTIKAQMAQSDIDGALVGGASLVATDFAQIVNY